MLFPKGGHYPQKSSAAGGSFCRRAFDVSTGIRARQTNHPLRRFLSRQQIVIQSSLWSPGPHSPLIPRVTSIIVGCRSPTVALWTLRDVGITPASAGLPIHPTAHWLQRYLWAWRHGKLRDAGSTRCIPNLYIMKLAALWARVFAEASSTPVSSVTLLCYKKIAPARQLPFPINCFLATSK